MNFVDSCDNVIANVLVLKSQDEFIKSATPKIPLPYRKIVIPIYPDYYKYAFLLITSQRLISQISTLY